MHTPRRMIPPPRRMSPPPRRMNAPQRGGMFPHTVTVYNQEVISGDKLNEITVNHITVLEGVLLISSKASNIRATGLEGADAVNLHIPFGVKAVDGVTGAEKKYVDPVEYWRTEADKSGIWTISIGTVFVKGRVVEADASRTALELGHDDVYQVTKVDKLDFGGMPHFEVGGN